MTGGARWSLCVGRRADNGGKSGGRSSAMFCLQRSEGSEMKQARCDMGRRERGAGGRR